MDSTRKQTLLYQHFGWNTPKQCIGGRVKVHEWGGFSTSQMRQDIESGKYTGWSDPRLPTIAGLVVPEYSWCETSGKVRRYSKRHGGSTRNIVFT